MIMNIVIVEVVSLFGLVELNSCNCYRWIPLVGWVNTQGRPAGDTFSGSDGSDDCVQSV